MSKVFHSQVASVLQSALREFRRVSNMTVEEMCAAGAAQSRVIFYSVYKAHVSGRIHYSRLANFYLSHLPEAEANTFLANYAKAWIAEDLGILLDKYRRM